MMGKIQEYFTKVERPAKIREYSPGTTKGNATYFIKYTIFGFIFLGLEYWLAVGIFNYPNYDQEFYTMLGINAIMWFLTCFMFAIPVIIAAAVTTKTLHPQYGFCVVVGFLLADVIFGIVIDWGWAIYAIFAQSMLVLVNIPSNQHYTVKWYHLLYFTILGGVACYISVLYTLHFMDVWTYLQCMITCTVMVMIVGQKMRQWADFYLIGYLICSLFVLISIDRLMGFAYFMGAGFSTFGAFGLFGAWRNIAKKAQLREEAFTVKKE